MGNLYVISGPSGSGKSEIIKRILNERKNVNRISTYTTRVPREGERNGEQYNFITTKEYLELLNNKKLMACSRIENDYYGAPIVSDKARNESDMIMDMGVSGGIEIKNKYPKTIMIYLIPETEEQLLRQRGDRGKTRQSRAEKQIQDVLDSRKYKWLVKNGDIENTVRKIELIMDFENKITRLGLTDKEEKMYSKMLEEMYIYSAQNVQFLKNFYKTREEIDR